MAAAIESYLRDIGLLPDKKMFDKSDLWRDEFLLYRNEKLSIYYAPFDYVNLEAEIILVGITPGWTQMECAFRTARHALESGSSNSQVLQEVKQRASFSGDMRVTLVKMLDDIGVPEVFGLRTSQEFFGHHRELVHSTSAVKYPVFVNGDNYRGKSPDLLRCPTLLKYVHEELANEFQELPTALIIPLGRVADRVLDHLIDRGVVDERRRLRGFPHPSGSNVHRTKQFADERNALRSQFNIWAESTPKQFRLGIERNTDPAINSFPPGAQGHINIEPSISNHHPVGPSYSRVFCFEHVSGDYLFPVRIRSRASDRTAFQVWDREKSETIAVEEEEMIRLVLHEDYAVRMKSPTTGKNGGYRRSGYSIVSVKLLA